MHKFMVKFERDGYNSFRTVMAESPEEAAGMISGNVYEVWQLVMSSKPVVSDQPQPLRRV